MSNTDKMRAALERVVALHDGRFLWAEWQEEWDRLAKEVIPEALEESDEGTAEASNKDRFSGHLIDCMIRRGIRGCDCGFLYATRASAKGIEAVECIITAAEVPDRISVRPPAGTFERGLVQIGAKTVLHLSQPPRP